jgi:hypothetical protein
VATRGRFFFGGAVLSAFLTGAFVVIGSLWAAEGVLLAVQYGLGAYLVVLGLVGVVCGIVTGVGHGLLDAKIQDRSAWARGWTLRGLAVAAVGLVVIAWDFGAGNLTSPREVTCFGLLALALASLMFGFQQDGRAAAPGRRR